MTSVHDTGVADPGVGYDGLPRACPECGGPGHLDRIDLGRRRQHESCPSCGERWTVAMTAGCEAESQIASPPASSIAGGGRWTRTGLSERLARLQA